MFFNNLIICQRFKQFIIIFFCSTLQLDGVRITPDAENPICRTLLRTDIYQLAAQANILNVPGSAVEDRQYQINVKGVCVYTTTWKNYQLSINKVRYIKSILFSESFKNIYFFHICVFEYSILI